MEDIKIGSASNPVRKSKYHYLKEIYEINKNETDSKKEIWLENFSANSHMIKKYKNIDFIFRDKQKWSQFECVLVGAGPSLDYDIADLKTYRKNVKIICTDSALHPLIKNNIKPDFVFTKNDEASIAELFSGFPTKDLNLVSNLFQSPEIFKKWKGEHYTYLPFDEGFFYDNMIKNTPAVSKLLKKPDTFSMGLLFAITMGFKRIFLLGGDYCFDDPKKLYCADVLYSLKEYDGPLDKLLKIKNIFAEKKNITYTTSNFFNQAEEFFRWVLVENPGRVMNCSRNSILYNLDWVYLGKTLACESKAKNNYFEFASMELKNTTDEMTMSNELTTNYFKAIMSRNMFDNYDRVQKEKTVYEILSPEAKEANKGKKCIICGSGPSLTKTIPLLKEYRDKFTVIAVDSSLMPLYRNGIDPDYVFTIDAEENCGDFVKDYDGARAIFIASVGSHKHTIDSWRSQIYFYFPMPFKTFYFWLLIMLGYSKIPFLTPNTNCGSTSILLAGDMGFKDIAITGIDLSFPGNRYYAEGVDVERSHGLEEVDSEAKLAERLKTAQSIKTIDCTGREVYTDATFAYYAKVTEKMVYNLSKSAAVVNVGGGILKIPYVPFDEYIKKVVLAN